MSLHDDLLQQANHLAELGTTRPKQASLRRAVSAAYCALFHFLVDHAVRRLVRGGTRSNLRDVLARSFQHNEMKKAAKAFASDRLKSNIAPALSSESIQPELRNLASAFVRLQEERHEADYNRGHMLTRSEAQDAVNSAEKAMKEWDAVKDTVQADTFLVSLLVYERAR